MELPSHLVNEIVGTAMTEARSGMLPVGESHLLSAGGGSSQLQDNPRDGKKVCTKLSREFAMDSKVLVIPYEDRNECQHLDGLPKADAIHEQHRLS